MSSSGLSLTQPKEKTLELTIYNDHTEELPELSTYIEEGILNKFYQDFNISVKITLNEKFLKHLSDKLMSKILKGLNLFSEERFKDYKMLSKILKKSQLKEIKLQIEDIEQNEDISQTLTDILIYPFESLDLEINIPNAVIFNQINEIFSNASTNYKNLSLKMLYSSDEKFNTEFMGNNLQYLKNLKSFKLHLDSFHFEDFELLLNQFLKKLPQMENLEAFTLVFDKIILKNEILNTFFDNIEKLPKLKKLSIKFMKIKNLNEFKSFEIFLSKLHETNLNDFDIEFANYEAPITEFLNKSFQIVQINEKIQNLRFAIINCPIEQNLQNLKEFIAKFPNINFLELVLSQTKMNNDYGKDFAEILDLENVRKIDFLRLILPYNNFGDDFGTILFKQMEKLDNLKFLFLDLQQSWQASYYLNEAMDTKFNIMIEKLVNLESILINLDGNEMKRASSYVKIENKLNELKQKHNRLNFFKLLERTQVDILGGKIPNYTCHLRFEHFFNEFYKKNAKAHVTFNTVSFDNLKIILQESDLQDNYEIVNLETCLKENKSKQVFKKYSIDFENPIFNPSNVTSIKKREDISVDLPKIFDERKISYSYFFSDNKECKFLPYPSVTIEEEMKNVDEIVNLKSKDITKISEFLDTMSKPQNNLASLIAKTPLFVDLLCQNEDILVNFSDKHFEKIMANFNPDDAKSITSFLNQIFRTSLNANMKSDIPALVLSRKDYCKYLTCESFAFLAFYAKKVSKLENLKDLSDIQKDVHKKKIASLTSLHLEENQYFSTRSCKEALLSLIDNKWKLIKLRSPDYFYDNDDFLIEKKRDKVFTGSSTNIQNSINEFYSNIREAIKDFELVALDDFYGDFILNLFSNLPELKEINVSNLNLGDKFCEGYNTFIASEKKKNGEYRFINLEIMNNIRITNVGLKFLYVSYQIMRNYFKQIKSNTLPKLKVFAVLTAPKKKIKHVYTSPLKIFKKNKLEKLTKPVKIMKKVRRKKQIPSNHIDIIKKNTTDSNNTNDPSQIEISKDKVVLEILPDDRGGEYEEYEVTDEEATAKKTQNLQLLLEREEKLKQEKIIEESKQLEDKVNLELSKKNLDDNNETIILNEGLGAFIQFYIKGLSRPKRFFCYNCDSEVCKQCHTLHHRFKECQPEFILCEKCMEIHQKNLVDCKIENQQQVICRGFRQILQEKKNNMNAASRFFRKIKSHKKKEENKCFLGCENCILLSFNFTISIYYFFLEAFKKCIMSMRKQFERCCIPSISNEKGEKTPKKTRCLAFLNCFFGDPDTIDDEVKEFKFNKNVIDLNHSLGSKSLLLLYSFNFFIYYFLVGFIPVTFRGTQTVLWSSHYIYASYAVLVFFFETYLTYFIIQKVNYGNGNKILRDFSLANYLFPLILSQIKKYDFYTDMIFIIANLNEDRAYIAIISGVFLAITTFMNLALIMSLFKSLWNISFRGICCFLFLKPNKKDENIPRNTVSPDINNRFSTFIAVKELDNEASNKNINLFCKISSLLELECIGNCLDKFSTKNAWLFPYFGGYYIPQQIISSSLKFFFEDLPSFIIQVFVISYYDRDSSIINLTPVIVTTCISLLASVTTVLTAKASILKPEELKLLEQEKIEKTEEETKRLVQEQNPNEEKIGESLLGKDELEEEKELMD